MRAPAVFDLFLDESIRGMGAQPEASENIPLPFYVRSRLSDLAASTRRSAPAILATGTKAKVQRARRVISPNKNTEQLRP